MKNKVKQYLSNYPKTYAKLKKINTIVSEVKRKIRIGFSTIFFIFPVKKEKIVICNYYGKGYGDNGKYIVEEIIRQELKYDIVWMLQKNLVNKAKFPPQVRIVKYGSIKGLYELATARIWIDNCRKTFYPLKRKNQYYIQTWHSPLRLKKIEKDAESMLSLQYIKSAKKDSNNINLMIAGCDFSWNIYKHSFWYQGEIMKCGTPRCDLFFYENKNIKERVYKEFGLSSNSNLVLFAPTFRSNYDVEAYKLKFNEILNIFEKKFGGSWKFLIRFHPNVSSLSSLIKYDDNVINATNYDDMQELLSVVDILITDYSSSMFDIAIANKICFLHGKDVDEYLKKEREMYFNFKDLPFDFSKTDQALIENIINFDKKIYEKKLSEFLGEINLYETGTASKQVVNRIRTIVNK